MQEPRCLEHPDAPDHNLFAEAVKNHDIKTVSSLLPKQVDDATRMQLLNPALIDAAMADDMSMTKLLLGHGADPDAIDTRSGYNSQPLVLKLLEAQRIPQSEKLKTIELLLSSGADPNKYLMQTVGNDNADVVLLMLKHGANVNQRALANCDGCVGPGAMPIHLAKSARVAEALVKAGADVKANYRNGRTVLNGEGYLSPEIALFMIENGADVNAVAWETTPLMQTLQGYEYFKSSNAKFAAGLREVAVMLVRNSAKLDGLGFTSDEALKVELKKIAQERK